MARRPRRTGTRPPGALPPPRKRLGQHFLADRQALERIASALDPTADDTVVEIGPGRGALTDLLVARAKRVIAIELDRDLAAYLRGRYAGAGNVEIIERDVLEVRVGDLAGPDYLLAGNVPYYITTPILFQGLEPPRPRRAVYLVQFEVAERVTAAAGTRAYGALSANVQGFANAELIARVGARAFRPPPAVDSAILRLTPRADPVVAPDEEPPFRTLVQQAFGFRRKQMRRIVRTLAGLDAAAAERVLADAGIDPTCRPETLEPAAFARLLHAMAPRRVSDRGS